MAAKERIGQVVSDKMDKTVVVAVETRVQHPKYGKIMVRTQRYKAHDEENNCKNGRSRQDQRDPSAQPHQTMGRGRYPQFFRHIKPDS